MWRHDSEFAGHEQATADISDCNETNEVMSYTITLAWFDAMLDLQGVRSTTSGFKAKIVLIFETGNQKFNLVFKISVVWETGHGFFQKNLKPFTGIIQRPERSLFI